jgi:hypothetical protein
VQASKPFLRRFAPRKQRNYADLEKVHRGTTLVLRVKRRYCDVVFVVFVPTAQFLDVFRPRHVKVQSASFACACDGCLHKQHTDVLLFLSAGIGKW